MAIVFCIFSRQKYTDAFTSKASIRKPRNKEKAGIIDSLMRLAMKHVLRTRASPNDHRLHTSHNTECKEDDKMLADHSEERVSNVQSSFCFTCMLPSCKAQNIQLLLCQSVRCASKSKDVLCLIFNTLLVY